MATAYTAINHSSKRLEEWNKCTQKHIDWRKHSYCIIIVDSSLWGKEQVYEEQTHPFEVTDDWINRKCAEIKREKHILKAEIKLYRKWYLYDPKKHCYYPEMLRYQTIRANL